MPKDNKQNIVKKLEEEILSSLDVKMQERDSSAVLEKYQEYLEKETVFKFSFPLCTKKGMLFGYDGDVRICTEAPENVHRDFEVINNTHKKPGETMSVQVTRIEKGKVYVTPFRKAVEERAKIIEILKDGIEKKEYIRVPATVIGFTGMDKVTKELNNSIALLNIADIGIIGSVRVVNWSTGLTSSLPHSSFVGDVVEVAVTGISTWGVATKFERKLFDCSRKMIMEVDGVDPWKDIEKKVPKYTDIIVTCVQKRQKNFFGVLEGLDDVEILCEYPEEKYNCLIEEGRKYCGYVYSVSEEKKKLCARIKEAVE